MCVLLGIKHSGKTTLGRMLSALLDCPFFDTDEVITELSGLSARQVYEARGRGEFMRLEAEACAFVADKCSGSTCVIATGGGICDNEKALDKLRTLGKFVLLQTSEEEAIKRILSEADFTRTPPKNLPAFIAEHNPKDEADARRIFHDFFVRRTGAYRAIADIKVQLDGKSPKENFEKLLAGLGDL